jgi:hypothetical protein
VMAVKVSAVSALLLAASIVAWRGRRKPNKGHCQHCGYDLTGNVSGVCPECGTGITSDHAPSNNPPPASRSVGT